MSTSLRKPFFLLFLVSLAVNLISALFYPLNDLLKNAELTVILAAFSYLFRSVDLLLSVTLLGAALATSRKERFATGLRFLMVLFLAKLVYWLIYALFLSLDNVNISVIFANFALHFFFYLGIHLLLLGLAFPLYRRGKDEDFSLFPIKLSGLPHKANLLVTGGFFLISFVQQILDTVSFLTEECFGILSMVTVGEWLLIAWDFIFIFASTALAFFALVIVENAIEKNC